MSYRHLVEAVISAEAKAKEVAAMKAEALARLKQVNEYEDSVAEQLNEATSKLRSFEARVASLDP